MKTLTTNLILLLVHTALAANFDNGLYGIVRDDSAPSIIAQSGEEIHVGEKKGLKVQKVMLTSRDNWNETFFLRVGLPFDPSFHGGPWHVLIIGEDAYKQSSAGSAGNKSNSLGFKISGKKKAKKVAQYFSIEPRLRVHPGHEFAVKFVPEKERFAQGEDVVVSLIIKNIGTNTVVFQKGGRNRASRDNQYEFIARHSGKQVNDIGQAGDFGGLSFRKVLNPGDTFEDSISVSKWFGFDGAGTYDILGTYVMEFMDPNSDSRFTIWEDRVCAEFKVTIEKSSDTSNKSVQTTK